MDKNINSTKFSATLKSNNTVFLDDFRSKCGLKYKKLILSGILGLAAVLISCGGGGGGGGGGGTNSSTANSGTVKFVSGHGATFVHNVWYTDKTGVKEKVNISQVVSDVSGDASSDLSGDIRYDVTFPFPGPNLEKPTNPLPPTNFEAKLVDNTADNNSLYKAYFLGWFKVPQTVDSTADQSNDSTADQSNDSTTDNKKWVFVGETDTNGNDLSPDTKNGSLILYAHWNKTTIQAKDSDLKTFISTKQSPDIIDTSKITNMTALFNDTFNEDIGGWDTSNVKQMSKVFNGAKMFNKNIGGWNTAEVTDMSDMFNGATAFNQSIGGWNIFKVSDMSNMFNGAEAFNRNIGNWIFSTVAISDSSPDSSSDTSINMSGMFNGAKAFNQNIGSWKTGNVSDFSNMFNGATAFNQKIGSWNVSKSTEFKGMFQNAAAFDADLSTWSPVCVNLDMTDMFKDSNVTPQNATAYENAMDSKCEAKITFNLGPGAAFRNNVWYDITGDPGSPVTITWASDPSLKKGIILKQPTNPKPPFNVVLNESAVNPGYSAYFLGWYRDNTADAARRWNFGDPSADKIVSKTTVLYARWKVTTEQLPAKLPATGKTEAENITTLQGLVANNGDPTVIDTSLMTSFAGLFKDDASFDGDISGWDTTKVTNFQDSFQKAGAFNQNIGGWNTSNVTNMAGAFNLAKAFNQPIGGWDTSKVTKMEWMLYDATAFNHPIGKWNTANVNNMYKMFQGATVFNQPIGNWNTSKVTLMYDMFNNAKAFNQDLSWDTANVTNMLNMFNGAAKFDGNITGWNTAKVTDMSNMFNGAAVFNRDLSWDTSSVTNMSGMFNGAAKFNQQIIGWNTRKVINMANMFNGATEFSYKLSDLETSQNPGWISGCTNLEIVNMFKDAPDVNKGTADIIHGKCELEFVFFMTAKDANFVNNRFYPSDKMQGDPAKEVRFSRGTGLTEVLKTAINPIPPKNSEVDPSADKPDFKAYFEGWFDAPTGGNRWNLGDINLTSKYRTVGFYARWKVTTKQPTTIAQLRTDALADPTVVDTSKMTTFESLFNVDDIQNAKTFNGDISGWDTSKVTNLVSVFQKTKAFNRNISGWNTSSVTNMGGAFNTATEFNQPIGGWDTSKVSNMIYMFHDATKFNQPLSEWDTSKVELMQYMFKGTKAFNRDISWDTSNVNNMAFMFNGATAFNSNINELDTSNVTNMSNMFSGATAFNQPIPNWNTGKVENMTSMFSGATRFNQYIGNWDTRNVTLMINTFENATSYNQSMRGWNTTKVMQMNGMFKGATAFNQNVAENSNIWNTVNVTNMSGMFMDATNFNNGMNRGVSSTLTFDVRKVWNLTDMFRNASSFNGDITGWRIRGRVNLNSMFKGASVFTHQLAVWGNNCISVVPADIGTPPGIDMFVGAPQNDLDGNSQALSSCKGPNKIINPF